MLFKGGNDPRDATGAAAEEAQHCDVPLRTAARKLGNPDNQPEGRCALSTRHHPTASTPTRGLRTQPPCRARGRRIITAAPTSMHAANFGSSFNLMRSKRDPGERKNGGWARRSRWIDFQNFDRTDRRIGE